MNDLEFNLGRALNPSGGDADLRERERAVDYLLAHAEEVFPRLLQDLENNPTALDAPALIDLIGRFGREEAIPILQRVMGAGGEFTARPAALALGRSHTEAAREALLTGLISANPETIIAAAYGLLTRRDTNDCDALRMASRHSDDNVRYHVISVLGALKCLTQSEWATLRNDKSSDIRALAGQFK